MKEQYKKEISQIHVPTEILEKTKLAMKGEEEKIHSEKSGKILSFPKVSVAVAAVLLLIMIPAASGSMNNTNMDKGAASEESVQMHLSGQEEVEIQAIKQDKNWFEELVDAIRDFLTK